MARRHLPALGVYRIRRTWLRRVVLVVMCVPQTAFWLAWVLGFGLCGMVALPIIDTALMLTNTVRGLYALAWSSPRALVAAWHGQTLADRWPELAGALAPEDDA